MKKLIILGLCIFLFACTTPEKKVSEAEILNESEVLASLPDVGINVGMKAPDFGVTMLTEEDGSRLSDFLGKPVLLNFFSTWCPPCVAEMPHFEKVYAEYGDDIAVLMVNLGEDQATVTKFIEKNSYTFPICYDVDLSIAELYNIQSIPQTFALNSDHVITDYWLGAISEEKLFEFVQRALSD